MKLRHRTKILAIVIVAALVGVLLVRHMSRPSPNVILISIDTLRPDHLGCYGYDRDTSPNLDRFAQEAILFENCFAQAPNTRASCGPMLSGFFPHELKVFNNRDNLPLEVNTVAELLRDQGYRTIAVVSNFVLRKGGGFDQGFDIYDDRMGEREMVRKVPERIAEKTTDTALSLLRIHGNHKFFMWIHYQDPHGPYTPPSAYGTMFLDPDRPANDLQFNASESGKGGIPSYQRLGDHADYHYYVSQYDGEIRYFDEHFKRLINGLRALGLYDNSMIMVTSDHGEGMGEHDYYFAHGEYVYNSVIHVPLLVRYGKRSRGRRSEYVQLIDIVPTILKVVGLKPDPGYRGRDLLSDALGGREIFSEMHGRYALIEERFKLIYRAVDNEYLLFDLRRDPGEERNLIGDRDYRAIAKNLAGRLAQLSKENLIGRQVKRVTPDLTDEEREKLKALGYVQ